jgi:hypothetical protein
MHRVVHDVVLARMGTDVAEERRWAVINHAYERTMLLDPERPYYPGNAGYWRAILMGGPASEPADLSLAIKCWNNSQLVDDHYEAIALARRAFRIWRKHFGDEDWRVEIALEWLAANDPDSRSSTPRDNA